MTREGTQHHIGFVSTRFNSTDGVSLEAAKWADVLEQMEQNCFFFAGESDRPAERTCLVAEASFNHPEIRAISEAAFSRRTRTPQLTRRIRALAAHLKAQLVHFVCEFKIEVLIVENALTIPMNIPLGLALTELIAESGIVTIAHHHDFFWERDRFLISGVDDYLHMAFPPQLATVHHVVINSVAAQQLSLRTGVAPLVIPNVMDFDNPPPPPDDYAADARQALGVCDDEALILQPTRVVQRKGIEHAIELVKRLDRKAQLVISHAAGDEGDEYEERVRSFAGLLGVQTNFVSDIIQNKRGRTADGRKIYALDDIYAAADLVTYPSRIEGFGNAFLEAVYFKRPIVVNAYSIYNIDIKPKGFDVIEFDGYIDAHTLERARLVLDDAALAAEMCEHNYQLARRHYSYSMLRRRLTLLLADCFGEE